MSYDKPRNQFNGELTALQSRRAMESLSVSPVSLIFSNIADVAGEFDVPRAGLFPQEV
jgi:hypothetical protein